MNETQIRPWYKKKRYLLPLASYIGILAISDSSIPATSNSVQGVQTVSQVLENTQTIPQKSSVVETLPKIDTERVEVKEEVPTLSNSNYYTNTRGNTVHSPVYTSDNSVPAGASARCRDGTYSFSQSRRGTCSRHGGVSEWL